jgi:hypothetical protein
MNLKPFYQFMCWYDSYWRRKNRVERFDDLLSFSFEKFSGERRRLDDGTWIEPGDRLAILHFNRECFTQSSVSSQSPTLNALRFRRIFFKSFSRLAKAVRENEQFMQVKAFHGVSWIPPHGKKVGFTVERVPHSAINLVRKWYLTLLVKTFFPHIRGQAKDRIRPYAYWMTRKNLLKYFSVTSD